MTLLLTLKNSKVTPGGLREVYRVFESQKESIVFSDNNKLTIDATTKFPSGTRGKFKTLHKMFNDLICMLIVLKLDVWIFQDGYIAGILSDTNRVSNVRLEQVSKDYPFDISRNVSLESHQNVKIVTSKVLLTSFALNQRECKILYFLKFFWS